MRIAPIQGSEKERDGTLKALLDDWDAEAAQKPQKRSIAVAGHRTSISLEEPFWDGLRAIALDKGVSVAALVAAIDAVKGEAGLSSAIRLFVYSHQSQQSETRGADRGDRNHDHAPRARSGKVRTGFPEKSCGNKKI